MPGRERDRDGLASEILASSASDGEVDEGILEVSVRVPVQSGRGLRQQEGGRATRDAHRSRRPELDRLGGVRPRVEHAKHHIAQIAVACEVVIQVAQVGAAHEGAVAGSERIEVRVRIQEGGLPIRAERASGCIRRRPVGVGAVRAYAHPLRDPGESVVDEDVG